MKNIHQLSILWLAIVFAFTSCVGDLDTEPLAEGTLLPEEAWLEEATYESFLAKIYAGLSLSGHEVPSGMPDIVGDDQGEATFLRSYWNLQELTTDEVIVAWADDGLSGLQFCQWTSSNRFCELSYNRMFLNIAYCNEYLRQTTDKNLAARNISAQKIEEVRMFRNEVRVLRALNYYLLMDLFANIPYIEEEQGVGSYLPEQKDRAFFFNYIESELKVLEGNLPATGRANYGKVNDPTVWMVLAKLYMNAEVYIGTSKYTEALTYLNKVLGAGYTLDPVYENMFRADNDRSPEIIFPIVFDGKMASNYGGTTYLMAAAYGLDMEAAANFGFADAWSGIRASQTLGEMFGNTDQRALFWKTDRTLENTQWQDFNAGWSVVKFKNIKSDGKAGSDNLFADTDFPFYRLADAYLMYAEAVVRGGTGGTLDIALGYVNELRDRAGIGSVGTAALTLDFLLEERCRELYWEGHRRTDLIRFGKFTDGYTWPWKNGVLNGTPHLDTKFKIFPIPATELSANTNIEQNSGY